MMCSPKGEMQGRNGLTRDDCIPCSRIFKEAFDSGENYVGSNMVMWLRRGEGSCLRLGVIASKRTFRRAVDRNRAKRLLRESFRLNKGKLQGDCDIVLVARGRILKSDYISIEKELLKLAANAGLLQSGL